MPDLTVSSAVDTLMQSANLDGIKDSVGLTDAGMGVVVHLADNSVARPTGFLQVTWIGSVEPLNSLDYDIWEVIS